jgi:hypothetical protein
MAEMVGHFGIKDRLDEDLGQLLEKASSPMRASGFL